ncbi:hypothetical protein LCGC14_3074450, partial [marine sediment metagenome]
MTCKRGQFEYDAAISFAGEDRRKAKRLSQLLTEKGYRVFYDANLRAHLWGRNANEFERIYGPASRHVIALVSKDYV